MQIESNYTRNESHMEIGIHRSDLEYNQKKELTLKYRSTLTQNTNKWKTKNGKEYKNKTSFLIHFPYFFSNFLGNPERYYIYEKNYKIYITTVKPVGYEYYSTTESLIINPKLFGNNIEAYNFLEFTFNPFEKETFTKTNGTITLKLIKGEQYVRYNDQKKTKKMKQ